MNDECRGGKPRDFGVRHVEQQVYLIFGAGDGIHVHRTYAYQRCGVHALQFNRKCYQWYIFTVKSIKA